LACLLHQQVRKTASVLECFPYVVPSLSWQNDRFYIYKWLKNAVVRRGRLTLADFCKRIAKAPLLFHPGSSWQENTLSLSPF
jgi:hypothetical protein